MYSYWHSWGLEPVVSLLLAAHVLIGSLFVLELTLAVVACKSTLLLCDDAGAHITASWRPLPHPYRS